MSYFFVTLLQLFLPSALLLSLLWATRTLPKIAVLVLITLLAVAVGVWAGTSYPKSHPLQLLSVLIQMTSLLLFLISQRSGNIYLACLWQALLVGAAALRWGRDVNLATLTATDVVNTELLLNTGAIIVALGWVFFCSVLLAIIIRQLPAWRWPLLLLLTLCLVLPLSGETVLLLMKLQIVPLTTSPLSYVALVTHANQWLNYFCTLVLSALTLRYLFPLRQEYQRVDRITNGPARRKQLAAYHYVRRIFYCTLLASLVPGISQLYWDRVASQPTRLSKAIPIQIAADNLVHIPLEQIRDGKLHRFVWIADEGQAVRFFVINRYPDRLRFGVVFDACLLCGDQGYVMEGNQVICVACGVQIFIPSIGKQGGCNPIPVVGWEMNDRELLIPKTALEAGVNYFTLNGG